MLIYIIWVVLSKLAEHFSALVAALALIEYIGYPLNIVYKIYYSAYVSDYVPQWKKRNRCPYLQPPFQKT
jgi:hypothetical protein